MSRSTAVKRPRAVGAAVATVIVVGALASLSVLLQALMTVTGRYLFTWGGADQRKPLVDLPQLLQADIRDGYSMFLEDLPAWLRMLGASPLLLHAVIVAAAVALVVRLCRRIASGDPFGRSARGTLTRLSLVLIVGGVAQGILDTIAVGVATNWISSRMFTSLGGDFAVQGLGTDLPNFPIMLIVLGIITAALAVAFREGARLREEMAGVV